MKLKALKGAVIGCLSLTLPLSAVAQDATKPQKAAGDNRQHKFLGTEYNSTQSLAYRWLDIAQEATAREVDLHAARPTIIARTLEIWATAMYDA
ncbi:MAG: hypothetical protein ABI614_25085, partial [Planctomycetota bacterium]